MQIIKAFIVLVFTLFVSNEINAQTVTKRDLESKEAFVARISTERAYNIKIQTEDVFNTPSSKIIFTYQLNEEGNIVKEGRLDSSICIYVGILCNVKENDYTCQFFKTTCSYLNNIKVQSTEVALVKKVKELQVNITENVRGPGGVPRGVTRNYVYRQQKEGNTFKDSFEPF
ncbi:MAG: hypothetical protein IPJ79_13155 [Bacteroidetes bacterium]|nr:hypothetical protein [Bacteroidota bacterium]